MPPYEVDSVHQNYQQWNPYLQDQTAGRINHDNYHSSQQTAHEPVTGTSLFSSFLGLGAGVSRYSENYLRPALASGFDWLKAGAWRVGGRVASLATLGTNLYSAGRTDLQNNDWSLPSVRREMFVGSSAIGAGAVISGVGYGAAAGAAAVSCGTPLVLGTIGALTVLGSVWAADWARDQAGQLYDRVMN